MTAKGGVSVVIGQQNGKKEKKSCSVKLEQANLAMMMKKIFLTIASVALMSNSNVWALSGGPFDNGDPGGLLMERGGFYQCQFSFKNGNGYGIFTPDSAIGGSVPGAGGLAGGSQQLSVFNRGTLFTPNVNPSGAVLGHNANRSVFYYKGLTYVGGCFGFVDTAARQLQGTCNATSDETITQQTLVQGGGGGLFGGGGGPAGFTAPQPAVINTAGFVLNVGWTGKITSTRPNMRFRGKGEMAVSSPGGESSIQTLAYDAYSGLIGAIIQSTSSLQNASGAPVDFTSASDAIGLALEDLRSYLGTGGGPDEVYADAIVEPVRVTGNRRFF
jgi:hypothetical protein